jgi:cytochrome c2
MIRKLAAGITLIGFVFASLPAQAGGWSVLTLDAWPGNVPVNKPITISFTLRQHGQRLMGGIDGSMIFERAGERKLHFPIHEAGDNGHYTATFSLPKTGVWQWRIEAFGEHHMPALMVQDAAIVAATARPMTPAQQVAQGKTLFVAKGCWMCHEHHAIAESGIFKDSYGVNGAPNLSTSKYDVVHLHTWLKDPKAIKPKTLMPNLGLKRAEIEALATFLTHRAGR